MKGAESAEISDAVQRKLLHAARIPALTGGPLEVFGSQESHDPVNPRDPMEPRTGGISGGSVKSANSIYPTHPVNLPHSTKPVNQRSIAKPAFPAISTSPMKS